MPRLYENLLLNQVYTPYEESKSKFQLGKFLSKHWKLLAVIGVAAAVGMAVFIAAAYFPPVLLGLGALTIKGIAPFAFLTTLPTSYAATILSTMAVGATYAAVGLAAAAKFLFSKISSKNEGYTYASNLYSHQDLKSDPSDTQKKSALENAPEVSSEVTAAADMSKPGVKPQPQSEAQSQSGTQSQPGNKETELRSSFGR